MEQKKNTKRPISPAMIGHLHGLYRSHGLDEETRRAMIAELTDGRTNSTRELTYSEAQYFAGYINGAAKENRDLSIGERAIKRQRSGVLKRLQLLGVDTTNWDSVNAFLCGKRIAGKPLYELDSKELQATVRKLEKILKKRDQ
nr:MAG TPA: Protein of unknown function (DUF1018) [Caudoviricetes sp.]